MEHFDRASVDSRELREPHGRTIPVGSWTRPRSGKGPSISVLTIALAMAFAIASSIWLVPLQAGAACVVPLSEAKAIKEQGEQVEDRDARPTPASYVDTNGKRVHLDERYLAQRTLSSGKTIIYRQNKRDIDALVKALRQDGVTDKRLLDPKAWLMWYCASRQIGGCTGKCGIYQCTEPISSPIDNNPTRTAAPSKPRLAYCACSG